MALHGMGRHEESRTSLAKAHARAEKTLPKQARGQPPTEDWANTIITEILLREAGTLFAQKAGINPAGQRGSGR
jgi:hypothetical protein